MNIKFCIQDPTYIETTYLYEAIVEAAADAVAWRGVYAFASRDGVNHLIEDQVIGEFIRGGGQVDLLVGLDAVTNRPTLERLQELERSNQTFRPRVFWNETNALFHPKLSDFRYGTGERKLIIGSGNLTPGGLMGNYESYTIIASEYGEEFDASALDEFLERHADEIRSIDDEALERAVQNLVRPIRGARRTEEKVIRMPGRLTRKSRARRAPQSTAFDRILIAQVPRAGGRWAQVHFNTNVVRYYFRILDRRTQRVYLTQVLEGGARADVEVRPCVFSEVNKNHKIEIGGAKGREYPENPPLLVFHERQLRVFEYMLLFPGDDGYRPLTDLTRDMQSVGRGFPRVITDMDTLKGTWNECPLLMSGQGEDLVF